MGYYVRKITLSKWPKPHGNPSIIHEYDIRSLRADAIADIRTFNDNLSIWSIASDSDEDIDEAVLALATSIKQEKFDKMDVVVISDDDILARGLKLKSIEGDTAVVDLKDTHRNIVGLTYDSLTSVMRIISEITIAGRHIRRNQRSIEKLITNNLDRIDMDAFSNDSIKDEIRSITRTAM